mgnify:CR=1 FL=1
MRQTIDTHIEGLKRNIKRLGEQLRYMTGPEFCPPNACCPSCAWGSRLEKVNELLNRREVMLSVMLCRKAGLKPRKMRVIKRKVKKKCPACNCVSTGRYLHEKRPATGRKTIASFGPCRECYGEMALTCPGRGVCHTCRGTGYVMVDIPRLVEIRSWPEGFDPALRYQGGGVLEVA